MRRYLQQLKSSFQKGDLLLLLLCLVTTAFGCLAVCSTTNYMGFTSFLVVQIAATVLGVLFFVVISSIDAEFFAEHRALLVIFNILVLLMLIPFGVRRGGNKSWLDLPLIPFMVQPAEICKITYILINASVMASHQNKLSSPPSILHMVLHLGILVIVNLVLSDDMGVSLIFVFIFIGMAFSGGVNLIWFLAAAGGLIVGFPVLWPFLSDYQQNRIMALVDPNVDPLGQGVKYQTIRAQRSLTGGGLTGQGLFDGHRTQQGALTAQHTDFIFSAIGEEMGYVGCALVLVLLFLIIARCIWVGTRSQDPMRRLICFGAASALIFQVISNVGMNLGVTPVIGLTLPFISYGGSSIVTLYAMLGLVSGVYARPAPTSHERYIRPPLSAYGK